MATLYHRYGSWWAIFTINYRQKWIRIGKMSKTSAKEVLRKLEQDYEKKKFKIFDEQDISFKEYAKEYLKYSKATKALNSYKRDKTSMVCLLFFFGDISVPKITPHLIERYKMERISQVAPRTVNIELSCLSHMFNKAVEWQKLNDTPFKGIKLFSYEKKPPRFLTKEEVPKLLDSASDQLKPILIFMLNTGIREGERTRLQWEHLDFERKRILIHSSKVKMYRVVPMGKSVEKVLRGLEKNSDYVFANSDGSPQLKIRKALSTACRKAGLKNVTPHTLRHTFASHLVMSGVDLNTVKTLLGHSNIQTTMIYSHLTEDHLARSVEKLPWDSE